MSRKRHSPKDIVGVKDIPANEFCKAKLLRSVVDSLNMVEFGTRHVDFAFWFSGKDGELVKCFVNGVTLSSSQASEFLSRRGYPVIYPVKLILRDGTFEYGFKSMRKRMVLTGKRDLVSYFIKDGIMNPSTGKWAYPCTLHADEYPNAKLMKLLPTFTGPDDSVGKKFLKPDEYMAVMAWMTMGRSNFVNSTTKRPEHPMSGIERLIEDKPHYYEPPPGFEQWYNVNPRFIAFVRTSYLKSVYRYDTKEKEIASLYRLSDLLSVTSEIEDENGDCPELWNSLDQTVSGNV